MDRLIYTSMTGAKHLLHRQETLANNLANANTTGFRAETVALRAVPARGAEAGTRVLTVETTIGNDFTPGSVQASDGNEAYTRAGNLQVSAEGELQLPNGLPVLGDGGPITVPVNAHISI